MHRIITSAANYFCAVAIGLALCAIVLHGLDALFY